MKKIIFTLTVLLSVSCSRNQDLSKDLSTNLSKDRSSVVEYTLDTGQPYGFVPESSRGKVSRVQEFKYKGHQYIQFDVIQSRDGSCGIVHNPDCPCHNSSNK